MKHKGDGAHQAPLLASDPAPPVSGSVNSTADADARPPPLAKRVEIDPGAAPTDPTRPGAPLRRGTSLSGRSLRSSLFPESYDEQVHPVRDPAFAKSEPLIRSRGESFWSDVFDDPFAELDDLFDGENPQARDLALLCAAAAAGASHVLLALRIDGLIDWDWAYVLLPEVVVGAAALLFLLGQIAVLVYSRGPARALRRGARLVSYAAGVVLVLTSLWLIVTRVKRGSGEGRSFVLAFLPIYAIQAVILARDVYYFGRKIAKWIRGRRSKKPFLRLLPRLMLFVLQLPIVAFTVVLPVALEAYDPGTSARDFWWVAFTPLWVFMPLLVCVICFSTGKAALADVAYAVAVIAFVLVPWTVFLYRLCRHLEQVANEHTVSVHARDSSAPIDFVWVSVPCFVSYGLVCIFLTGRIAARAAASVIHKRRYRSSLVE